MTTATTTVPTGADSTERRRWLMLAVLITGQFMALLDVTIVNVAIPTIREKLDASGAALQLIVAGYTVTYAMLLITGARLGDLRGPRRLFLAGLGTFTLASLACGLAPTTGALITARSVQGAGAALMVPQILSVIQRQFAGGARARALGVYAATLASGAVVGQVLGGLLVSADLLGASWRPVFLVNVPVGLVAAALVRPERSAGMKVSSVKKKLKEKAFAPGVNREEVYGAEATLGLPLDEFIATAITGVQQVAPEIGL